MSQILKMYYIIYLGYCGIPLYANINNVQKATQRKVYITTTMRKLTTKNDLHDAVSNKDNKISSVCRIRSLHRHCCPKRGHDPGIASPYLVCPGISFGKHRPKIRDTLDLYKSALVSRSTI